MWSLPSRGAWIEIWWGARHCGPVCVAPLAGSVDRNASVWEGVLSDPQVAPLAGSVDRNQFLHHGVSPPKWSLPSRGAWIEIIRSSSLGPVVEGRSPRGERG